MKSELDHMQYLLRKEEECVDIYAQLLPSGIPTVRYTSSRTIYDEALVEGSWISRYWASDGKVMAEKHIWENLSDLHFTQPLQSFCLEIDGQTLHSHWSLKDIRNEPSDQPDTLHTVVELAHGHRPIEVRVHTLLNGTAFITRWLEIKNTGTQAAALSSVSPWSGQLCTKKYAPYYLVDKVEKPFTLGYFQSSLPHFEADFAWKSIEHGVTRIEGRKGHSGYGMPFFIVRNEMSGEYFIGHLAWSGNWHIEFQCENEKYGQESNLIFKIGPSGRAPQRVIPSGQSVTTPRVYLGHMHGDFDACIQENHRHLRRSAIPLPDPDRRFLVKYSTLNESGDYFTDKSKYEESILKQVDIASELGIEVFLVENAWQGKAATHGSWGIAGDWWPNGWLPNGLKNIREYIRQKNMLFGLYAEIETLGFESDVYAQHPDWVMMRDGKPVIGHERTKRGLLDLTKPEVAAWMESEIIRLTETYEIDLFRIDANVRLIFEGGERADSGFMESTFWRYYENLYAIWRRVQKRFPKLILQQASSGGCRNDLGIMGVFHEAFLTDGMHTLRELQSFGAFTLALPPEIFNIMPGLVWPPHEARGSLETQLRITSVLSHPYIADVGILPPELGEITPTRMEAFKRSVQLFKDFVRPLLGNCLVYHHAPITSRAVNNNWFVIEYSSPDKRRGLALIVKLRDSADANYNFIPKGLRLDCNYALILDSKKQRLTIPGMSLAKDGITVNLESYLSSELLLFSKGD